MLVPSYLLLAALSSAVAGSPFPRRHPNKRQYDSQSETVSQVSSQSAPTLAIIPMDPTTIYSVNPPQTFVNTDGQPIATQPGTTVVKTKYIPYTAPSAVNLFPSTSSSTSSLSTASLLSSSVNSNSPISSSIPLTSATISSSLSALSSSTSLSTYTSTSLVQLTTTDIATTQSGISVTPMMPNTISTVDWTSSGVSIPTSGPSRSRNHKSKHVQHLTSSNVASSVSAIFTPSGTTNSDVYSATSSLTLPHTRHSDHLGKKSSTSKPGHKHKDSKKTTTAPITPNPTPSSDSTTIPMHHATHQSKSFSSSSSPFSTPLPTTTRPSLESPIPSKTSILTLTQTSTIHETVYATRTRSLRGSNSAESRTSNRIDASHQVESTVQITQTSTIPETVYVTHTREDHDTRSMEIRPSSHHPERETIQITVTSSIRSTVYATHTRASYKTQSTEIQPSSASHRFHPHPPPKKATRTQYTLRLSTEAPHYSPVIVSDHTYSLVLPTKQPHHSPPPPVVPIVTTVVVPPHPPPAFATSPHGTLITMIIPRPPGSTGAGASQPPSAPFITGPAAPEITILPVEIKGFVTVTRVEVVFQTKTATVTERYTETVVRTAAARRMA